MPDRIHRTPQTRLPQTRLLALVALLSGLLVAGCGGSSGNPAATAGGARTSATTAGGTGATSTTAATAGGTGTRTTTRSATAPGEGAAGSGATAAGDAGSPGLAFSRCMRANGVPSFPDPKPGGGYNFQVTVSSAPAFRSAQARCQKLLPGGGLLGPGANTHPTAQTLRKLVEIARCMRRHDVPQFPDPRTSIPSNPSGIREITNFDGAILLFPTTINLQSPAYRQALAACGAPPLGLAH